jgi:pyruvate ferredoxin oxidoreductase delta subunit
MNNKNFEIQIEKGTPPVNFRWHARGHMGFENVGTMIVSLMAAKKIHSETETSGDASSSPLFGAEKEGKPKETDNTISYDPIESFCKPKIFDVKIIADTTIEGVTANTNEETIFVVNAKDPEEVARQIGLGPSRVIAVDATAIAIAEMKKIGSKATFPNTAVMGAFIHIFPFISPEELYAVIKQKYRGRGEEVVDANITCAKRGYEEAKFFDGRGTDVSKAKIGAPKLLRWDEMLPGAAVYATGNMDENHTGSWRTSRPIRVDEMNAEKILAGLKKTRCTNCMICVACCPEDCILVENEKVVGINLDYCKGCGICNDVCPFGAIGIKPEEKAKKDDKE